jgi:hypothetical protein
LPPAFEPGEENRRQDAARDVWRPEYFVVLSFGSHLSGRGISVWLRWISYIDPFTYAVHALKALLLKNTGFSGIYSDILILSEFSGVLVSLSVAFFKRQI